MEAQNVVLLTEHETSITQRSYADARRQSADIPPPGGQVRWTRHG
jgi:hypothetical protein